VSTVTFVHPTGERTVLEIEDGASVMETAIDGGIDEIVAECGGSATCATCHVYVDEADHARIPARSTLEDQMLDATVAPRRGTSRLACQLVAGPKLGDLTVHLPDEQC
jgi:2Fe-2S ferredoxin